MIHDAFNTHFSTSRDISVLRMKLKNFKAHSKRSKTGSEAGDGQDSDDNETSITDGNSGTDTKQVKSGPYRIAKCITIILSFS